MEYYEFMVSPIRSGDYVESYDGYTLEVDEVYKEETEEGVGISTTCGIFLSHIEIVSILFGRD